MSQDELSLYIQELNKRSAEKQIKKLNMFSLAYAKAHRDFDKVYNEMKDRQLKREQIRKIIDTKIEKPNSDNYTNKRVRANFNK